VSDLLKVGTIFSPQIGHFDVCRTVLGTRQRQIDAKMATTASFVRHMRRYAHADRVVNSEFGPNPRHLTRTLNYVLTKSPINNRQPPISNRQPPISNRQSTTANRQPTTDNRQSTTANQQSPTADQQSTINNQQSTIANRQSPTNNRQSTTVNQQSPIKNRQSTPTPPPPHPPTIEAADVAGFSEEGRRAIGTAEADGSAVLPRPLRRLPMSQAPPWIRGATRVPGAARIGPRRGPFVPRGSPKAA